MRSVKHWIVAVMAVPLISTCVYAGSFTDLSMEVTFPAGLPETPVASIYTVSKSPTEIDIVYYVVYPYGSPCDIEMQYKGGTKLNWTEATLNGEYMGVYPDLDNNPPHTYKSLSWNREFDQPGGGSAEYHIRIRAKVGVIAGPWDEYIIPQDNRVLELKMIEFVKDQDSITLKFYSEAVSSYTIYWIDNSPEADEASWNAIVNPILNDETQPGGEVWKTWTDEGDNDGTPVRLKPSEVEFYRHYYIKGN